MRNLVVRLGDLVRGGGRDDVRAYVAPLVDVLLSLRGEARRQQRFKDADRLRAILGQCGVEVQDTPPGRRGPWRTTEGRSDWREAGRELRPASALSDVSRASTRRRGGLWASA